MKKEAKNLPLREYKLSGNIEISEGVHLISFKRDFDFIPGQVVKIALDIETAPRIYSICSGNREPEVHILFNIKEGGVLTPKLAPLIPGEKILVSQPYGSFVTTREKAVFIATGTGIAPFYSMLVSGFRNFVKIIHGVRYLSQFYFEDEFEAAAAEKYIRCCSREISCNSFHGRVTDYLKENEIFTDAKYYICGQALMVVEVRDLLISKGIGFEKISAEIYF